VMGREGFEPSTLGLRDGLPDLGHPRFCWKWAGFRLYRA